MNQRILDFSKVELNAAKCENNVNVKEISYRDIAVIGVSSMLPGVENTQQFWNSIINGVDFVTEFPANRRKDIDDYLSFKGEQIESTRYLKGAYLDEVDKFDYAHFRMTPREASLMSPLQRIFLETALKAIEDAGYGGNKLVSSNTGVYAGFISDVEGSKYKQIIQDTESKSSQQISLVGNISAMLPSRISYLLDFKGPSMLVDTACSSSLVAIHLACQAIRNGDCNQAIVGSVRVNLLPIDDGFRIGMESSDGLAKTFDDSSDGTGAGEGAIAVLLKPLDKAKRDGDNVYAVIKGSAVNQDGASMGITAPNSAAQADVIVKAWQNSGVNPETITYIEAHGTGTKLGDPIEIEGIEKAFGRYTDKKQFCAIGSVKTNIGHLYEAAGLAGFLKAVLALRNKVIPPSIHFNKPNHRIYFEDSPVYVNDRAIKWETAGAARICGVSSFGFSGTNCHVVLEEAPEAVFHGILEKLYENKDNKKTSPPTLSLNKSRCWVNIPEVVEKANESNLFYNVAWKKEELIQGNNLNNLDANGITLVLQDDKKVLGKTVAALKSEGRAVVEVETGYEFVKVNDNNYIINHSEEDYFKLFNEIGRDKISKILHTLSVTQEPMAESAGGLEKAQNTGVFSLLHLVRALVDNRNNINADLVLISEYAYEVTGNEKHIKPENAAIFGLAKAIGREYPGLSCKCIDMDEYIHEEEILAELKSNSHYSMAAYREGKRYVEEFRHESIEKAVDKEIVVRNDGVYIITGGAGGIGLEVAKHLSSKGNVNICIIGRSELPAHDKWDEVLNNKTNDIIFDKIKVFKELESKNAQVVYFSADISNEEKMRAVTAELREKFGKINGMIHCAGIGNDELISGTTEDALRQTLKPKVLGTLVLDRVTSQDEMDFFVMFSSVASLFCMPGQGAYAAANSYLDSFAAYRSKSGKKTLTINWVAWKNIGMASKVEFVNDTIFKAISAEQAVISLFDVINVHVNRLLIGELNYDSKMVYLLKKYPIRLSMQIRQRLDANEKRILNETRNKIKNKDAIKQFDVKSNGNCQNDYFNTENKVSHICSEVLGFDEIDVQESFFDMGADSIILTQVFEKLDKLFPGKLSISKLFSHPSVSKLARYIYQEENDQLKEGLDSGFDRRENESDRDIAIIGMSARFPAASDIGEFWGNVQNGMDCVGVFPEGRKKDAYDYLRFNNVNDDNINFIEASYLDEIDKFDYRFFRLSPREASLMDPNQRLLLETAYSAIEDAGYGGSKLAGSKTGMYIGFSNDIKDTYVKLIMDTDPSTLSVSVPGNLPSLIPSRISYFLDLKGPSMLIDTACSSSLVAMHIACNALRNGECDTAIAGGVKIHLLPLADRAKIGIESSDNKTKAFDDFSDGTGIGEGVAAVVLKPLSKALADGDNIYAVVKGSSINQDGSSVGITAPNAKAQTDVILDAWRDAGVDPETISYIEAHGTGTKLGDPIEIEGIQEAFRRHTGKKQFCAVSTVKTNIGHLYESSGIAGLIKAVMSLKYKKLAPLVHFRNPNHKIDFEESPVYINDRLLEWETENVPRRCGISSFGFSGTNCHVVLEEAPEYKKERSNTSHSLNIFTVSAKSEESLVELAGLYGKYLGRYSDEDLCDICHTANTGRGHNEFRIAILARDLKDLKSKIDAIGADIEKNRVEGVYYNKFKVVSQEKGQFNAGEISDKQKRELSEKAKLLMNEFVVSGSNSGSNDDKLLSELCSCYTKGADIEWDSLYTNCDAKRISLPTYSFERLRCWINIDSHKSKDKVIKEEVYHPLLEKCLSKSINQDIYVTVFHPEKQFVLTDHTILGNYVIAGATYFEMLKQASRRYYGDSPIKFYDINFITPVILHTVESREVQTIIKKEDNHLEFIIASCDNSEGSGSGQNWIKHAEGKLCRLDGVNDDKYDIEVIKNEYCKEKLDIDQNKLAGGFIKFGPRWLNYHTLWVGENVALAELKLPDAFKQDIETYYVHPALIDMAVAAFGLTLKNRYLPLSYKKLDLYRALPAHFYSYITRIDRSSINEEVVKFDAILLDADGRVLAEAEDFTIKKVHEVKKFVRENEYSEIKWIPQPLIAGNDGQYYGTYLVFTDSSSLSGNTVEKLEQSGQKVIKVSFGSLYKKIDKSRYVVSGSEEDYIRLLSELEGNRIRILHMFTAAGECTGNELRDFEETLEKGIYSLFYLMKAISANKALKNIDMAVISGYASEVTGGERVINPSHAAVFGLSRVIPKEFENVSCRCIDVDDVTECTELISELSASNRIDRVAYRNGIRYVEEIDIVNIESVSEEMTDIKDEGVYIITGGTGAIGLEIGKYLASRNKVNLCLISRSGLPDRAEWDEILQKDTDGKICRSIRAITEMEAAGSKVHSIRADVACIDRMKPVLDDLRNNFGRIDGIVHCAGVAGDGFIMNKKMEAFNQVVEPKIKGAWILDHLTQKDDLDFFIMQSSIASILGLPGQGDYTAANSYLDAFSAYRSKYAGKTISINWPAWKETGMAVDFGVNIDTVFEAIPTGQALMAFEKLLERKARNVIVGEWTYNDEFIDQIPMRLSNKIKNKLEQNKRKSAQGKIETGAAADVKLKGRDNGEYSENEKVAAEVWGEVLGFKEINIFDNFYDLGGDSILAAKLVNRFNKKLSMDVSMADIFNNLTIADFAAYMDSRKCTGGSGSSGSKTGTKLKKAIQKEYYPVSHEQRRIFAVHHLANDNISYNIPVIMMVEGNLDKARLENAARKLGERHEALRTSFEVINGELVQRICDHNVLFIEYADSEGKSLEQLADGFIRPFDLKKAPLVRMKLVNLENEHYLFMLDIHHIIADGTSSGIILNEFFNLIEDRKLPELNTAYKDYSEWQRGNSAEEATKAQEHYWLDVFSGDIPVLNMVTDFNRPSEQSYEGRVLEFSIGRELVSGFKKVLAAKGVTLYMGLLAVYNVLLSKYTGQDDIIIGSPIAGRLHTELENVVGMFVNMLPMRNYPNAGKTFNEFMDEVKYNSLKAFENQSYRFEELIEKIGLKRDLSRNPLFDTMFLLQNSSEEITNSGTPKINVEVAGLRFTACEFVHRTSKYDLSVEALERDGGVACYLEYCTKLFKHETMEKLAVHFIKILEEVTGNPEIQISKIDILTEKDKKTLVIDFNDTKVEYEKDKVIQELFEERVKGTNGVALAFKGKELSYKELNEKVNQLAWKLRNSGVKPNSIVGVMSRRSLEMMIGILAVMKAGGAYLPIDPEYPEARIKYMLEDSGAKILLTQEELEGKIGFRGEIQNIDSCQIQGGNSPDLPIINSPEDLLYVIYTSGSTGTPKGVMITHKSANNFIKGVTDIIDFPFQSTILALTTISFDIFFLETVLALVKGLKVVIADENQQYDPRQLNDLILNTGIDMLQITPSRLKILMSTANYAACLKNLKVIMVGGEQLPQILLDELKKATSAKIYNMYGPTETTIWSTIKDLTESDRVNIGKPIANTTVYILDGQNSLMNVGQQGELCIGGDGLAKGYLNTPGLTSEKFVQNPFKADEKMYRTGDIARWLPNGDIECLGRMDHQVKIRGFRIELGEIEARLLEYEAVNEAVVIARKDKDGNQCLCAYFTSDRELTVPELREPLAEKLADYMIPSYFIRINEIPLTSNGKIDRKALPEPDYNISTGTELVLPGNEIEQKLLEIWEEVLGRENFGIKDNFFEIGGNSILLISVYAQIEELYPGKVKVTDIFAYPTIFKLARFIKDSGNLLQVETSFKFISLPEEYFLEDQRGNSVQSSAILEIKGELFENIKRISSQLNNEVYGILLSMYLYLFAVITEQSEIEVHSAAGRDGCIIPLRVDMDSIPDIGAVIRESIRQLDGNGENSAFKAEDILKKVSGKNGFSVLPLFCKTGSVPEKPNLLDAFDIILQAYEDSDRVELTYIYNAGRLKEEKIEVMIDTYLSILSALTSKM